MTYMYTVDENGKVTMNKNTKTTKKKKKKKQPAQVHYTVDENGKVTMNNIEDIAPVKKKSTKGGNKDSIFKAGGFSDGIDGVGDFLVDLGQSTVGTLGDIGVGIGKGITRLGEGIVDAGKYGVAGIADATGNDDYAKKVRKSAKKDSTSSIWKKAEEKVDNWSVLGNKADKVTEGLGQVAGIILTGGIASGLGAGSALTTAITTGATGISGMGSGISQAYQEGATDKEAYTYGTIAGVGEAATELLFGGLGKAVKATGLSKGLSSADDMLAKKVSGMFNNQIAKNFAEFGIKSGAEGTEEVLSGIISAVGKKVTYMEEEELQNILKDENLLEQFVVGSITSGITQSGVVPGMKQGSLIEANKQGTDFITGLTENEQKVVDKEFENRIAEAEKDGKTLDKKEKSKIYDEVLNDLDKGYISIDTIESALGGDTYKTYQDTVNKEDELLKEYEELGNKTNATLKEQTRYKELADLIEENKNNSQKEILKSQLADEVLGIAKDSRLAESYNEKTRRSEVFKADLSKYDTKQQEVIKKATESGILNNTNRTHEFVDMVAKISADKGVSFDFTNNQKLKESGFALEGKTVNGYVKDGNIALNIDSSKSLNIVVGHEITHVLEGTELYTELQKAVKQYAETKGEYFTTRDKLAKLYKNVENVNLGNEVTADLVGDYLFTDKDFINNLSVEQPNIFKKIFDEIKYLCKMVTAGSKEARQLEKVKRTFENAYKESIGKGQNEVINFSLKDIENMTEKSYNHHGWAKVNDVLTNNELADFQEKVGIKKNQNNKWYMDLEDGRHMFAVGEEGVNSTLIISDGDYNTPSIEKVYKIDLNNETDIEIVRDVLYENEKQSGWTLSSIATEEIYGNGIIRKYTGNDFETFQEQSRKYKRTKSNRSIKFTEELQYGKRSNTENQSKYPVKEEVSSKDDAFFDADKKYSLSDSDGKVLDNTTPTNNSDIRYSLSEDTTLTEEQEALIRETSELTFTKNYGKDTYSVMGYDKNENATYIKYGATKEELSQAFGEDIANEITSYKIDLQQHKLDESFLNLPASKDTEGRKLSKEQKEYFKNIIPELKDDNGNLKVLYHGTPNEFTQFNYDFIGSNGTALGKGFYLTDSRDIASGYVGENGKIMELYANIEKPLSLTEKNITKAKYKKFVKAVDKATGGDYLSNYGEVDYEGYNNVLSRALDDYTYDDNDVDLIHSVFNVSGLGWEEGFRLLKKTLGYDGVVQHNFQGTGTTVFVPTLPEQIKSVTNQNPTDNADINLSLSKQGQELSPYGNYNVYGKDIALEQNTTSTQETISEDIAPIGEEASQSSSEEFEKLVQSYMNSDDVPGYLFEDDEIRAWAEEQAKKEIENPTAKLTAEKTVNGDTVDPFENRDIDKVGNRKTNAYMYENPEVKPFFQEEARVMLAELQNSVKGERGRKGSRYGLDENEIGASNEGWFGTKRETSEEIAYLLDKFKYSYKDIEKGLKAIIEDNGAENNAISKRIEFKLDERLRYGHDNFMGDDKAQPNQEYINLLNDKQVTEYSDESFNSWVGSLKDDIAPVEENVEQNLYSMEDTKNNEINELDTKVEETEKADEPELTVNESFDAKIENYKNAIRGYNDARTEIETAFDEAIEKKTKEYENLKRKNTKKASDILMQIENLKLRKANNLSNIDSRIEKTQTRIDNMIKNSETIKQGMYGKRRKALHTEIMDGIKSTFSSKGFDFDKVLENAKDKSTFASVDNTPQRFMEKTLGYKEGQALADLTVNKVAQNESAGIKWVNENVKLLKQISKEYDIKPGSKESAAAQMYAEGFYINDKGKYVKYGNKELLADFKDLVVIENIKKLAKDSRIRSIYDETLDQINKSRTRNAYPEIPKRDNYFLHFIEMDDTFSRLGIPFNPNDIRAKDLPTDINGMTVDLKPGQPYFASAMHRKGLRTTYDLLGGVEKYLNSAKNQIFHIDDIQTLRATRNYIADMFGQAHGLEDLDTMTETEAAERIEQVFGSHLSNFAKFLHEEANVIAGKTALIDRGLEGVIGRKGITFLNTLNGQVGSNMIGFNASSSLTNFVSVMQSMAKSSKVDTIKAFTQTVSNKLDSMLGRTTDGFSDTNPAIIRRKGIEKFARKPFEKVSDSGYILMSAIDDISTELIVRTKFNELTRKGMSEEQAHIESDKWAHRILGDRSLGQQPLLYNSKMLGLVTKFQLEVRNQLDSQFYDTIQDANVSTEDIDNATYRNAVKAAKVGSTLVQLAVLQHVFGKAFESVAGYNPAFDIIEVLMTTLGYDDEEGSEDEPLDNIEQGFLALLEDMPYTSVLTGGRIPIASALPITELIKGEDSYGREKPRTETLKEMAPYYLLPTGYGQIKKTKQGLDMFSDKHPVSGSYTDSGDLRFPVEDTPKNRIQAGLFGQYANENARYYFDNDIAPLKEKQIKEYVDVDMPIKDYWEYREGLKGLESLNEKGDYIGELDIPVNKKNILINNIANRKEPIDFTGYEDYKNFEELDFYNQNPKKYKFLQENDISYEEYSSNKDTKKTYDWAYKNPKKYKFLQSIDVSYKDYNKNDDTREAYTWAFNNPDKYTLSKAASSDVVTYRKYTKDLYNIKADKDKYGKSITGSRKKKVANYINKLDADYGEKLILFKSEYNSDDTYNREIIDYLNNREDITFDEMNTILKELGFTVTADGTIYWN